MHEERRQVLHAMPIRVVGVFRIAAVAVALGVGLATPAWAGECEDLRGASFGKARVRAAVQIPAGTFAPPGAQPQTSLPEFCRVVLTAKPVTQSNITIEVWLPSGAAWNGRLLGTGNGGFAGSISFPALASGLRRGYATANTDMGTFPAGLLPDNSYEAGIGNPEMVRDWGHRASHEMTLAARAVISSYYGRKPDRAYFMGCSTGGHQGLMEAQRYPDDYDGIIAGAPGHNRTHLHTAFARFFQLMSANPDLFASSSGGATVSSSKLAMVREAGLASCGRGRDGGAASDTYLNNPNACSFDPQRLQCAADQVEASCLTPTEVKALNEIYGGTRNPRTDEVIYPAWPYGSELTVLANGGRRGSDATTGRADGLLRWVLGAKWDARTLDLDRDVTRIDKEIGKDVNALDAGLAGFQKRGGKLILFHGWDDPVVSAFDSVLYLLRVQEINPQTHSGFIRLFMAPGVGHCQGGAGPDVFGAGNGSTDPVDPERDILTTLERWVETGHAPERIVAGKRGQGGEFTVTRPLCAYPNQAMYSGTGDSSDARSFACAPGPGARFEWPGAAYLGGRR